MKRFYSMAYLTANGAGPVEAVEIAARSGYDFISFRLLPAGPGDAPPPLMEDDGLLTETVAAMKANGIPMADAEMIRLAADSDLESYKPFLDRIALLGARHILTAIDDPDRGRAIDNYARLCELVAPYGFTADLEFMPWTACKTIRDALQFVESAGSPAAAILFDSLHYDRCGATPEDIAAIPARHVNYFQLCDGPADYDRSDAGLIWLARNKRMIPGRGDIDFAPILRLLPDSAVISIEVPDRETAEAMGRENFARTALDETRSLVEALAGDPA